MYPVAIEEIILCQMEQIQMKHGLKKFGGYGVHYMHKDKKQLRDRGVPIPVHPSDISRGSHTTALTYLMVLKMKRNGTIKGRGYNGGRPQRSYTNTDEIIYPTVSIE